LHLLLCTSSRWTHFSATHLMTKSSVKIVWHQPKEWLFPQRISSYLVFKLISRNYALSLSLHHFCSMKNVQFSRHFLPQIYACSFCSKFDTQALFCTLGHHEKDKLHKHCFLLPIIASAFMLEARSRRPRDCCDISGHTEVWSGRSATWDITEMTSIQVLSNKATYKGIQ
jgi:hypothetical protein